MTERAERGVLLMAYGSPGSIEDVEAYYTHIRGGRKPSPERVEELAERYRTIGGSPLNEITEELARRVEEELNSDASGSARPVKVYVGMKHWHPFIEDVVDRMAADGIRQATAMALAPQYSRMSVEQYLETARNRAKEHGIALAEIREWHDEPAFIDFLAARLNEAIARLGEEERQSLRVVFTAHSLPERILEWNDPYPDQLLESSRLVAEKAGVGSWDFAYQSASQTGTPWLGPDILDYLEAVAGEGARAVVACPVGFVADHLEILYDLDLEAKEKAESLGMRFERTASPNAEPEFVHAVCQVIRRGMARA